MSEFVAPGMRFREPTKEVDEEYERGWIAFIRILRDDGELTVENLSEQGDIFHITAMHILTVADDAGLIDWDRDK